MRGYLVKYRYRGSSDVSSYSYQRFFRALYGYTQVVTKSNGKTYIYYRRGVLTTYPYIRPEKNVVVVPSNAFEPLVEFFKTGKNPAHNFENLDDWNVTYYVEEVPVEDPEALKAIYSALNRIVVRTPEGVYRLRELIQKPSLDVDELSIVHLSAKNVVESPWFQPLQTRDPLLKRLSELFTLAEQSL